MWYLRFKLTVSPPYTAHIPLILILNTTQKFIIFPIVPQGISFDILSNIVKILEKEPSFSLGLFIDICHFFLLFWYIEEVITTPLSECLPGCHQKFIQKSVSRIHTVQDRI